jgi:hypothetical protein
VRPSKPRHLDVEEGDVGLGGDGRGHDIVASAHQRHHLDVVSSESSAAKASRTMAWSPASRTVITWACWRGTPALERSPAAADADGEAALGCVEVVIGGVDVSASDGDGG